VVIVTGHVSISYLQTYKNAGKFRVFVAPTNEHWFTGHLFNEQQLSQGLKNVSVSKEEQYTLRCCNASLIKPPPKNSLAHPTEAFTIDTYAPKATFSEIRTTTLRVHGSGTFNMHFRHVPLTIEEIKYRGGDKVKIVGLRSC